MVDTLGFGDGFDAGSSPGTAFLQKKREKRGYCAYIQFLLCTLLFTFLIVFLEFWVPFWRTGWPACLALWYAGLIRHCFI
jgi:uncharacterized integral membrane protein